MFLKKIVIGVMCVLLVQSIAFSEDLEVSLVDRQEYQQDHKRILDLRKKVKPGQSGDLRQFEKNADELHGKWKLKDKEYHARIMVDVCRHIGRIKYNKGTNASGIAERRALAGLMVRKYGLAGLDNRQEISLKTELDLMLNVVTIMSGRNALNGQAFEKARKKDVEVRLHAWRRLLDSIDSEWDPNDGAFLNMSPDFTPEEMKEQGSWMSGMAPEAVKNPKVRARYVAALKANAEKARKYSEQIKLRRWQKLYMKLAEEYIVAAYSRPPYNNKELEKYLEDYKMDEKTKARIIGAVNKNIEKEEAKAKKLSK